MGLSLINHPFWVITPIFRKPPYEYQYVLFPVFSQTPAPLRRPLFHQSVDDFYHVGVQKAQHLGEVQPHGRDRCGGIAPQKLVILGWFGGVVPTTKRFYGTRMPIQA